MPDERFLILTRTGEFFWEDNKENAAELVNNLVKDDMAGPEEIQVFRLKILETYKPKSTLVLVSEGRNDVPY